MSTSVAGVSRLPQAANIQAATVKDSRSSSVTPTTNKSRTQSTPKEDKDKSFVSSAKSKAKQTAITKDDPYLLSSEDQDFATPAKKEMKSSTIPGSAKITPNLGDAKNVVLLKKSIGSHKKIKTEGLAIHREKPDSSVTHQTTSVAKESQSIGTPLNSIKDPLSAEKRPRGRPRGSCNKGAQTGSSGKPALLQQHRAADGAAVIERGASR
jgi:hypothetical protein